MTRDNAYIFASSNLRAKENTGSAKERLEAFKSAPTAEALCQSAASAFGIKSYASEKDLFEKAMGAAVADLRGVLPDFSLIAPLLYKYDCTNVKLIIKCSIMGIDPEDMLLPCGSISEKVLLASYEKNGWNVLPENMKKAANEATGLYRKTGNAQVIDLTLDKAAFADMSADAEKGGVTLIKNIVSARGDSANILTALRIKKSNADGDIAVSLLERSLVCGGEISADAFASSGEVNSLPDILKKAKNSRIYGAASKVAAGNYKFAEAEKIFDESVLSMTVPVKQMAYGIEVAVRYLLMREAEILNCRVIAAGLSGSIAQDEIGERMRVSYV